MSQDLKTKIDNWIRIKKAQFAFAQQSRLVSVLFVLALLLILVIDWLSGWTFLDTMKTSWDDDISQLVAFSTLGIALSVWWSELIQEWRNHLPKRLTVEFVIIKNGKAIRVMRCEEAHLTEVADIRSLGQQIGSQLANADVPDQKLTFRAPYVKQTQPITKYEESLGFYQFYKVEFTLNNLPNGMDPDTCLLWRHPFDKSDIEKISLVDATD